ncbi:hypothetical protein NN3_01150 [Nocardia neocaledoniensis NBRC 108232]|uniref:Uncharacterized protein n=1 Tax=Nocardia neocaledoniensis TaxID=236511 RepID=A0A317NHV1_9NOCA|nr:hypothetical protein [Nocardia neocaledoniensis]PWV74397.1 hypothetical protein DFR69_106208 [Nocardia neocaledoniensis]GEM29108.1 hypothetical protein NN3_01150 [Nocardia neocaledoniensis NBRC 108232]
MSRTVAGTVSVWVQAVVGLVLGAMFWTAFQVATPDIGHWLVNALVLAQLLALAIAGLIQVTAPRLAVFGWSAVVGGIVYGYAFSLLVLIHL